MAVLTFREALRRAMLEEMERDPEVFIIGEEVAQYQGTFRVTEGLLEKFGAERVIDTPISEEGFTAVAVGASMMGLKPIVEFMTVNFSIRALDQICNHAAKTLYMSGGQFSCPMVVRAPNGKGERLAAQHSHSLEAWFMYMTGLKIVLPSTPYDARGLLKSAIRDPNPVIFLEHPALYNMKAEVPEAMDEGLVPIGEAAVMREGGHVTLVSYSRMAQMCLKAAETLAQEGIEAEVLDLRSLVPMDENRLYESIAKTHRAVVVTEENPVCSAASEIVARINKLAFDELDAPVEKITGQDTPMPYARNLEKLWAPDEAAIVEAARRTLWRRPGAGQNGAGAGYAGTHDAEDGRRDGGRHHRSMEEGTIVRWLKNEGDKVQEQEIIAEISTEKANIEIPSTEAGVLSQILVKEGETVPVGTPIAVIGNGAKPAAQSKAGGKKPAESKSAETKPAEAAQRAPEPEPQAQPETGGNGHAQAPTAVGTELRVKASPLARKVAAEHGVDLKGLIGSGPGGRIVEADVEEALRRAPAATVTTVQAAIPQVTLPGTERPMSPMRKIIAKRLTESKQTIPHFYLTIDVDMRAAARVRAEYNGSVDETRKISFNDMVVRACVLALEKHRGLTSRLDGEVIKTPAGINIGVAVSLDEGLIVPVVKDAHAKGIATIGQEVRDLADRARKGQLKPDEYSGGSFTVSNLGMHEITLFQAVINPPEVAILAVGAIRDTPIVENGQIVAGKQMYLTISVDHRVVDGSVAAVFMQELKRLLQTPLALFS
jgi:pyruvate dehydrogenase E1 component beta subunit